MRHLNRDQKQTAAGLAVKWKTAFLDRGNSKWKGLDEAMRSCAGSSQVVGVSGVESVIWEVMGGGVRGAAMAHVNSSRSHRAWRGLDLH